MSAKKVWARCKCGARVKIKASKLRGKLPNHNDCPDRIRGLLRPDAPR